MKSRQITEITLTELFKADLILKKVLTVLTPVQMEEIRDAELRIDERKKLFEFLKTEGMQFCRICGCTHYFACDGGCSWIEDDLCSACADPEESEGEASW